jgi:hypothetical protein
VRLAKQVTTVPANDTDDGATRQEIQLCAIKILSKHSIIKARQVDHVFNELSLQRQLRYPFIVIISF